MENKVKPKFKKWTCEIIIEYTDEEVGDWGPRRAAIESLENRGFNVLSCGSGWGGKITDRDVQWAEYFLQKQIDREKNEEYLDHPSIE